MIMEFNEIEKMVAKILARGDLASKRQVIASLIVYEKTYVLKQIRDRWGEEEWNRVLEIC